MVLSMKVDKFEGMPPICALAAIFFPGVTSGRNVLHDQLVQIIGDRADTFGDLRSFIRPFYHMAKLAPWSIGTYAAKPFEDFPREVRDDAYGLLREHGCESLSRQMFQRDHQAFLGARTQELREANFHRWVLAETLLNGVVAHLAMGVRVKRGIGTESDPDGMEPDVEGVWDIGNCLPRRRAHLKLLQGGRR